MGLMESDVLMEDCLISVVLLLDTNFPKDINCYKPKFFLVHVPEDRRSARRVFGGKTL